MTIAQELLAALDGAHLLPLPSTRHEGFTMDRAYEVSDELRRLRIARGEAPRGYKIGFTNRTIWDKYGVHAPIWGSVWDSTLTLLDGAEASVSLGGLAQPRIEPEIVFGFAGAPRAGMDEHELRGRLAWVAHGFEIVQTHFEGWRFTAPDTVADFGLHGRLIVGPRVPLDDWHALGADLSRLRVQLTCDGRPIDEGDGSRVLDGPLNALRLWVDALAAQPLDWPIHRGDVVTTGTMTDAWPLEGGQRWSTRSSEPRLSGLALTVQTRTNY